VRARKWINDFREIVAIFSRVENRDDHLRPIGKLCTFGPSSENMDKCYNYETKPKVNKK
jgi:hypothetical protein